MKFASRKSRLWITGVMFALLMFVVPVSHAQFDSAVVLGTIRDTSGAGIPGVTVKLTNVSRGTVLSVAASGNGSYEFSSVQVGDYVLTAEAPGFQATKTSAFTVVVQARQKVDVMLKAGGVDESVTVSGAVSPLETETSDRGLVISEREIVNLPLNGRAYADLTLLSPGVRLSTIENGTLTSRDASYDVNGLNSMMNGFLLDGLDNNAYQTANQGFSNQTFSPSPDALAEYKVETDNYSAQYGRAGGAIINATTKSGTDRFHGLLYEYVRNTDFNAYGPFYGTGIKPRLVQNQFGGTLGGPVLRSKLFFFLDYEGFRHVDHSIQTATVPTANQLKGTFVDANGKPVPLVNPVTGTVYTNGVIPMSDWNPLAKNVVANLPAPNQTAALGGVNFVSQPANTDFENKGDFRTDYFISPKSTAFARVSLRNAHLFQAPPIPGLAGGNSNGPTYISTQQLALGYTRAITSRQTLEARFGLSWTKSGKGFVNEGSTDLLKQSGITGLPADPALSGGLNTQIITGFSQLGRPATQPQYTDPYFVNPKLNYTSIIGRHSLSAGFEYGYLTVATYDFRPMYGSDTYAGQFSRASGAQSSTTAVQQNYNFADFLIGARSHYELSNNATYSYERIAQYAYVQDDWKTSSRLTVNIGLRYDLVTPFWEQNNRQSNFDPATVSLALASSGSIANRALFNMNYLNFAPRLGFAYQIDPKTVVRAGYALSYAPNFRWGGQAELPSNLPYAIDATTDQTPPLGVGAAASPLPLCAQTAWLSCFRPTQAGYATGYNSIPTPPYPTTRTQTRYIPKSFPTPYVQTYQLSIQRQLPGNAVFEVAYVGNHGVHITELTDYNQAASQTLSCQQTGTGCLTLQQRRPIPTFTNILETFNGNFLLYNSLQTKLEKRYSNGLYLVNSFTYSHAIDNASFNLETANGDSANVNFYNIAGDRGRSSYDQPLNDTFSTVWDIPYGEGRHFGAHAPFLLKETIGGWTVTAINQATSGQPINLTYAPNTNAITTTTSTVYTFRPNLTGSVAAVYNPRSSWVKTASSLSGVYSKAAVSVPGISQPYGNAGRNILRGPSYYNLNLGVHKQFPLGFENSNLEFRAEAFNIFNHSNYTAPDSAVTDGAFGSFTSSTVQPSRQLQMALRLAF